MIVNRREFVREVAVYASVAGMVAHTGLKAAKPLHVAGDRFHLIYDERSFERHSISPSIMAKAEKTFSFSHDITPLWETHFRHEWALGHVATIGLTRSSEFFVLATLAREHGYLVESKTPINEGVFWTLIPSKRK